MLHEYRDDDETLAPAYAGRFDLTPPPKNRMPEEGAPGAAVYRAIHDELLLDGSSRLNLATFVTTWMEPQAHALIAETLDKNAIDKDEYPQTAEIERRCVSMVAHLFHASEHAPAVGASTIGSSEAVMLAGLAMKWRWRHFHFRDRAPSMIASEDPWVRAPVVSPGAWKRSASIRMQRCSISAVIGYSA